MNRIRFSPASESDLTAIHDHIHRNGDERAATRTIRRILDRVRQLSHFPYLGMRCMEADAGWRSFLEGAYAIYYRESDDGIELLRVVHGKRDQRRALGQDTG